MMFALGGKLPNCPVPEAARLFREGKLSEGFDVYGKTLLQSRDVKLAESTEPWLAQKKLLKEAGELAVCTFIARLTQVIDDCEEQARERLWAACLGILRRFSPEDCTPRQDTTDRYVAECILLRHMKKPEDGMKAALEGLNRQETSSRATFAGLCALDLEDEEKAEKYIRIGLELDPNNAAGCNDLADYYFDLRRYGKAMEYYGLAVQSTDPYDLQWAEPNLIFCRYMVSNQPMELERLALCAAVEPKNGRAGWLCDVARWEKQMPYLDYIPHSMDAAVNMLGTFREKNVQDGRMALTCLEAASAINALRLDMSRFGQRKANLDLVVNHIPEPPLDELLAADGMKLWHYKEDNDTEPVVPVPSSRVLALVKELAELPFTMSGWYEQAGELVRSLNQDDVAELYGCMVFPPAPENPDILASDWLLRIQFAAVCLLARLDRTHFWAESQALQKYAEKLPSPELARICLGQLDWPVIPALSLMAWQVKAGIASLDAVSPLLDLLMKRVAKENYCFFEHALICALSWLPGHYEAFHLEMHQRRRFLEEA